MFHPQGPTLFELAMQALSSTERGYDRLAAKFDYTPFRTPAFVIEACRPFFGTPDRALDLCCGTGAALPFLVESANEVVGLDRSRGMLQHARQLHADRERLRLLRADALALPFHEAFDLITCFGAFGHILPKDETRFTQEIVRVLRPEGRFVFVTSELPKRTDPARWLARGFNAAMHVRNALWSPEFVMYYLTFLLPQAQTLLEEVGCIVEVHADAFPARYSRLRVVVARKPSSR